MRLRAVGLRVHELPFERYPGIADVRAARILRGLLRHGSYDVVHAHSSKAGGLVRLVMPSGQRAVYTPHCFAFAAGFGLLQRTSYALVEQLLLHRTTAVVAVSQWEFKQARHRLARAERVMTVIRNGVPAVVPSAAPPGVLEWAAGRRIAGYLGRLDEEKGPVRFVRAFARACRDPDFSACGLVVGDGRLRDAVRSEIARHGLEARLRHEPYGGDVAPWLACFSLFVLPSRWESLPISVLEAMSAGVPVLATAVGGTPEAVIDGVTGRLVPAPDDELLARALHELLTHPEDLERMGEAGRERVARHFTVDRMVAETATVYETVWSRSAEAAARTAADGRPTQPAAPLAATVPRCG